MGRVSGVGVRIAAADIQAERGEWRSDGGRFSADLTDGCRLRLVLEETGPRFAEKPVVTVESNAGSFSFFVSDVQAGHPIWIPDFGVAVTSAEDARDYDAIETDVRHSARSRRLDDIAAEPEETYEKAAGQTRSLPGQTWLGLSRDVRIFAVGFRGVGAEDRLWDWIQPRFHGFEAQLPENGNKPVRYCFMLGRGVGCTEPVARRLEEGKLPILHARVRDDDVVYDTVCFVAWESSPLEPQTVRGTHALVADGFGQGHVLTEEQERQRRELLQQEQKFEEEPVLYVRTEIINTGTVPRYAWLKNAVPNGWILGAGLPYRFDGDTGFAGFSEDRVFAVSKLNGRPLAAEETALLLAPGETAVFDMFVPHRPIPRRRAERLAAQDSLERLEQCRRYWKTKLASAATVRLPEKRIENMVGAGLLHLDLVAYGREPDGPLVAAVGAYTAIGSESAPIIQFMDSMGWHRTARRSIAFFLDKQREDGMIQNYAGYMLETGAVLWTAGEHYRYTRDDAWAQSVRPNLEKAYRFLKKWREGNRASGWALLDGRVGDPDDPYRSFMLNGYAYLGLSRLTEMYAHTDPAWSEEIRREAEDLKHEIRRALFANMARSPVVPTGDGSWIPSASPWAEGCGPACLYARGGSAFTHGTFTARDALTGPLYLVFQEVLDPREPATEWLIHLNAELFYMNHVAFSQPYYSIHPWVHLKRGEVKPFLKAYYNGFAGLADRETYSFWEHYWHASPHKTHEEAWFLMQTRWMLYMEDMNGPAAAIRLLPGVPRRWLRDGQVVELDGVATYFGRMRLRVESRVQKGVMSAVVDFASGRTPPIVDLRLPHPDGIPAIGADGGVYDPATETIRISRVSGRHEITLFFKT